MPEAYRPHTRTHTMVFRGCRNTAALLSSLGEEKINEMFHTALTKSGFQVVRNPRTGEPRVMCHPFDPEEGYTAVAILASSDATLHAYPEDEFGVTIEAEFNLCYLWPATVPQHQAFRCRAGGLQGDQAPLPTSASPSGGTSCVRKALETASSDHRRGFFFSL